MRHIDDISVVYTDRAIHKNLLYDKTPIHLSNDVDLGESLAKFADILQPIKEQVNRKEYFSLNHIIRWAMKKHNIKNYFTKAREYASSYNKCLKKDKRFILAKKNELNLTIICFEDWEHNRKIFIENTENPIIKRRLFNLYSSPRSFFYFIDYFFMNIQEYKKDKRFLHIEFEYKKRILELPAKKDDKCFIMHRIIKNPKAMDCIRHCFKNINVNIYKNPSSIFLLFNSGYFGNSFILKQKKTNYWVLSLKQIESLIWIRDNYDELFNGYKFVKQTLIDFFFDALRDFIKKAEYEKDDYKYVENKIYRSLWL